MYLTLADVVLMHEKSGPSKANDCRQTWSRKSLKWMEVLQLLGPHDPHRRLLMQADPPHFEYSGFLCVLI